MTGSFIVHIVNIIPYDEYEFACYKRQKFDNTIPQTFAKNKINNNFSEINIKVVSCLCAN